MNPTPRLPLQPLPTVLFAWDGTKQFIASADHFVGQIKPVSLRVVHAMPHESIYTYGTVGREFDQESWQEQCLKNEFRSLVNRTDNLASAKLELLFGDRVREIVRYADQRHADFILMPRFKQSSFSKWIHGDLNQKIAGKARCRVVFLETADKPAGWSTANP